MIVAWPPHVCYHGLHVHITSHYTTSTLRYTTPLHHYQCDNSGVLTPNHCIPFPAHTPCSNSLLNFSLSDADKAQLASQTLEQVLQPYKDKGLAHFKEGAHSKHWGVGLTDRKHWYAIAKDPVKGTVFLGVFGSEEEAARFRDKATWLLQGRWVE